MPIQITRKEVYVKDEGGIFDVGLHEPILPLVQNSYNFRVAVSFVSKKYRADYVSFECDGKVIHSTKVTEVIGQPAEGLTTSKGRKFWVEATVPLAGLTGQFRLYIVAHLETRAPEAMRWICLASIFGAVSSGKLSFEPKLRPLLLTSGGRVGSSLVMSLLAAHPKIVTNGIFPHEMKCFLYWMRSAQVLSSCANHANSTDRFGFEQESYSIGFNPFFDHVSLPSPVRNRTWEWVQKEYVDSVWDFFARKADEFYCKLAEDQEKQGVLYFAEKASFGGILDFCHQLYPRLKEIILVRDPRDVYASIRAFNKRRAATDFGAERARDDFEHVSLLALDMLVWTERYLRNQNEILLVRYEDLIQDYETELTRVFRFLELDADKEVITKVIADGLVPESRTAHMTSHSVESSVGRWKKDLPPNLAEHCSRQFENALRTFGYFNDPLRKGHECS
jgi:hypothetical protein